MLRRHRFPRSTVLSQGRKRAVGRCATRWYRRFANIRRATTSRRRWTAACNESRSMPVTELMVLMAETPSAFPRRAARILFSKLPHKFHYLHPQRICDNPDRPQRHIPLPPLYRPHIRPVNPRPIGKLILGPSLRLPQCPHSLPKPLLILHVRPVWAYSRSMPTRYMQTAYKQ
jgi:hypothetical protein